MGQSTAVHFHSLFTVTSKCNGFPVRPPRSCGTTVRLPVRQVAADSLVEDFVITESAEAVEEAIAESTVQQVRGGASKSA